MDDRRPRAAYGLLVVWLLMQVVAAAPGSGTRHAGPPVLRACTGDSRVAANPPGPDSTQLVARPIAHRVRVRPSAATPSCAAKAEPRFDRRRLRRRAAHPTSGALSGRPCVGDPPH